jgi:drug/metabolite transporter (DMT)-like permease
LAISVSTEKRDSIAIFREWKYLVPASGLLAVGIFFWYDSVANVGASKEGLLSGPLEVIVILILASSLLKEKLARVQRVGAVVALSGFFVAVMSAGSFELLLTFGDIEAGISALAFGTGVILVTRLTRNHSALLVSGASLLISGAMLAAVFWASGPVVTPMAWATLFGFSLLPLLAAFTYVVGLRRIGSSMTSVIGSFSILLTMLFQLVMLVSGVDVMVPSNISLAVLGGALGILGIYLIHRKAN